MPENLIVVGWGAGAIGRMVAERLGYGFMNVERTAEGELGRGIAGQEETVISVGDGILSRPPFLERLRGGGKVIFLLSSVDELARGARMEGSAPAREDVEAAYRERVPVLRRAADHVIDTAGRRPEEIAERVVACYTGLPPARPVP